LADLSAGLHQANVPRVGVLAAHHQAVLRRFKADTVALEAILNALPHLACHLLCVGHSELL
jgi:hypothetical protein